MSTRKFNPIGAPVRRAARAAVSVALLACGTVAGAPPATREGEAPLTLTLTIDGRDYGFTPSLGLE